MMSRLHGKSLIHSTVDSEVLVHCCEVLLLRKHSFAAMEIMDSIQLHIMSCPSHSNIGTPLATNAAKIVQVLNETVNVIIQVNI